MTIDFKIPSMLFIPEILVSTTNVAKDGPERAVAVKTPRVTKKHCYIVGPHVVCVKVRKLSRNT